MTSLQGDQTDAPHRQHQRQLLSRGLLLIATYLVCSVASWMGGYQLGRKAVAPTAAHVSPTSSSIGEPNRVPTTTPPWKATPSAWATGTVVVPCWQLFPSSSRTLGVDASWQTYTDPGGRFSIKYPGDWSAGGISASPVFSARSSQPDSRPLRIGIEIGDADQIVSPVQDWRAQYAPFYASNLLQSGDRAYIFTARVDGPYDGELRDPAADEQHARVSPQVLCGMLSTLRFTE